MKSICNYVSVGMVCLQYLSMFINLAKQCYCNADVCMCVYMCFCELAALCHTIISLNVGRLITKLYMKIADAIDIARV